MNSHPFANWRNNLEREKVVIEDTVALNIRFAKSNKFIKHVNQHTKTLCFSACVYLFSSAAIIFAFMMISRLQSCIIGFKESAMVYFGTEYIEGMPQATILCEIAARDLFSVLVVGVTISNIMVPQNPIEIAEFFTFKNGKRQLRYWIMLPPHEFLHDVTIRVLIIKKKDIAKDDGKIKTTRKQEREENFDMVRGVRNLILDKKFSKSVMYKLLNDHDYMLCVIIRGTLSNGRQYYAYKTFEKERVLRDCAYMPIDKAKIKDDQELSKALVYNKFPETTYMHFNLAYSIRENQMSLTYFDEKRHGWRTMESYQYGAQDCLMRYEFYGIKGFENRLLNRFANVYLNSTSKISAILRKCI